jgi:pimeloyl-ACP methyl ester carboxylesterase
VNPEPDFDDLFKAVTTLWLDQGPSGYPGASVEAIAVPTLIIRGDHDPLFPLEEAVSLKDRIPESEFMNVPFAGHAVQAETPEILAVILETFLRRTAHG